MEAGNNSYLIGLFEELNKLIHVKCLFFGKHSVNVNYFDYYRRSIKCKGE